MKSDYDFKRVDKKKIDKALADDYAIKHNGKAKKSKTDYDLVGQMPERMQKRYFDTVVKNK
jgi:hypothetical protein